MHLKTFPKVREINSRSLKNVIVSRKWEVILYAQRGAEQKLLGMVMREYPCLLDSDSFLVFFFGQQKPCQAITSFIDAWVVLALRTDVASQETIIQRAILNTWIAPQNHKLLTCLHVVIWKCKDGKWEKNTEPERNWKGEMPKLPKQKKGAYHYEKEIITWKTKCSSIGVFSFTYRIILSKLSPTKEFLSTVWMFILSWISLEESTDKLGIYVSSTPCHLPTSSLLGMV